MKISITITAGVAALAICLGGGLGACAPMSANRPITINPDVDVNRATQVSVERGLATAELADNRALDEAKKEGLVGEQPNGYLGFVGKSEPQLVSLVSYINHLRKLSYQRIAASNHTDLIVVEKLAGKRRIERAPAGQYVRLPSGVWRQMP